MSARKKVKPALLRTWKRLIDDVERQALDLTEMKGFDAERARSKFDAALEELNEMTVAACRVRKTATPQLIKQLACKLVQKTERGGDALAARHFVNEVLVTVARLDAEQSERLLQIGALAPSFRLEGYADPDVVTALTDAVVASTRPHTRLEEAQSKLQFDARLAEAHERNPDKTKAECKPEVRAKRRTRSGTTTPDEHVLAAAQLVGATTTDNAATYQSQVRAARKR